MSTTVKIEKAFTLTVDDKPVAVVEHAELTLELEETLMPRQAFDEVKDQMFLVRVLMDKEVLIGSPEFVALMRLLRCVRSTFKRNPRPLFLAG